MTALGLAQIGEFSFILAKTGLPEGLLSETDYQRFLGASILSMIATPFLIKAAPRNRIRVAISAWSKFIAGTFDTTLLPTNMSCAGMSLSLAMD